MIITTEQEEQKVKQEEQKVKQIKTLNLPFSIEEYELLDLHRGRLTWHDYLLKLAVK